MTAGPAPDELAWDGLDLAPTLAEMGGGAESVDLLPKLPEVSPVAARQAAALSLAEQGFAVSHVYGVRPDGTCRCPAGAACSAASAGKHGGLGWLEQATRDPAVIRTRFLAVDPGYGLVPLAGTGRLVVDEDVPGSLEALGPLPSTFIVRTGLKPDGKRGRHAYGVLPPGIAEADIPYQWAGGEVRIAGNGQVIGPYCRHRSGVFYEPVNDAPVAELPESWVRALIASGTQRRDAERAARGPEDAGWRVTAGRHVFLVGKARNLRGVGLTGGRLLDEIVRLDRERCDPPLADVPGRGMAELREIAGWTEAHIADDGPGIIIHGPSPARQAGGRAADPEPTPEPIAAPPAAVRPGRIVLTLAEMLAAEIPTPAARVAGLLPGEGFGILAGPRKHGKTLTELQLGLCVAGGVPFLGRAVTQTPVLIIEEEGAARAMQDRLRGQAKALGVPSDAPLRIAHRQRFRLDIPADVGAIDELIAATGAGLVIIGPLAQVASIDENSNSADGMAPIVRTMTDLAARHRALVKLVHHLRKPAGIAQAPKSVDEFFYRVRGADALVAGVDVALGLWRPPEESEGTLYVMARDGENVRIPILFDARSLTFAVNPDPDDPMAADVARFVACLSVHRGRWYTRAELEGATRWHRTKVLSVGMYAFGQGRAEQRTMARHAREWRAAEPFFGGIE